MKHMQHALVTYLLKQTRFYYKGQELHLDPRTKKQMLANIWQTIKSELRQELQKTK